MIKQTFIEISPMLQSYAIPAAQSGAGGQLLNGLIVLLLTLASGIFLAALMVTLAALLPTVSKRSQSAVQRSPWRAFFIGLANYLFLGGIALILLDAGEGLLTFISLILLAFLTIVTAIGLAGLVKLLGERLAGLRGEEMSPLKQVIWGAVALELASLLPFIGWFLLAPIVLMLSFGAAVLAWRNRKQNDFETIESSL